MPSCARVCARGGSPQTFPGFCARKAFRKSVAASFHEIHPHAASFSSKRGGLARHCCRAQKPAIDVPSSREGDDASAPQGLGRHLRFSHPILAARPAKPVMENQSRAMIFGADGGNHFLVASWAVAAASGIIVTSQRHSLARSKSVRGSVRSNRLCLDLSQAHSLQAGARECLSGNDSPRVKAVDCFYMGSRIRNSQPFLPNCKIAEL